MNKTSRISRREAISLLAGCLLTSPTVSAAHVDGLIGGVFDWSEHLKVVFRHWDSARRIGRTYRMMYPHDCNPEVWLGRILGADLASGLRDPGINEHSIGHSIARKVRLDFESDNVVLLDGWVLSRTEARLCVATYML